MTTVTLRKNYKRLENRLETLERIVEVFMKDELISKKVKHLEKVSKKLDQGTGRYFSSHREFSQYIKSL